jgi:muramidase (phage lysozyme)
MEPTGVELDSTAAGAFQYLARTWDGLRARHPDLIDFSGPMQDRALIYLLDDLHAIDPIVAGDIGGALAACCKTWASLPGAGYGQHENSASDIEGWFVQYGGTLAKSGA